MYPILFQFGPVTLYSYGVALAAGFLIAAHLASRRAAEAGIPAAKVQTLCLVALGAGLLGGRVAYVLLNWEFFSANPAELLRLDHGGLVFYGGFIAGVAGALAYAVRAGLPVLKTLDILVGPLALAHAVGRVGCFLNGCCYGTPSSAPWAVPFPDEGIPRHPVQLYEAAALTLLFFWLSRLERRDPPPGSVLLSYTVLYGTWRFLIEFLRGDNADMLGPLSVFQLVSLALVASAGALLLARRGRSR